MAQGIQTCSRLPFIHDETPSLIAYLINKITIGYLTRP
jgi:predicted transcriptional regulator